MSSTKVKERKGKHLDFYETPDRAIDGLLSRDIINSRTTNLLEPCAGRGAIVKRIRHFYPSIKVTAIEIQEEFSSDLAETGAEFIIGDFLKMTPVPIYDCIIVNPPFSQAEEFIRHCHGFLRPWGQMSFLLRLPFVAGVKRYELFKELRPSEINVLSQRPKFGGSNIDSCDYAWLIWWRNPPMNITIMDWIEPICRTQDQGIGQACGA